MERKKMLKLPEKIWMQMIDQAAAEAPLEACGILAGRGDTIDRYYPMTNADASCDHFTMEPTEQFAVVRDMRGNGMQMLAVAHSHPETPARPSDEDLRLALTPDVVYVIISLQDRNNPDIKGFLIEDGHITETPIEVIE